MADVYLVRHGSYTENEQGQILTELGVEESQRARDELAMYDLGQTAVLLSSTLPRAEQTANIIGAGLDLPTYTANRLAITRMRSQKPGTTLGDLIKDCFLEVGIDHPADMPVIAIGHAPFIESVLNANRGEDDRMDFAENGGVYKVSSNTVIGYSLIETQASKPKTAEPKISSSQQIHRWITGDQVSSIPSLREATVMAAAVVAGGFLVYKAVQQQNRQF